MNSFPLKITGAQIASDLFPEASIVGEDEDDTALLHKMSEAARSYVSSFSWCSAILNSYFGGGVGGIFAVFFFHIRPNRSDVEPWIWIVVGDIPPAYLPLSDCKSPTEVFRTYIRGMSRWVELARKGETGTPEEGVPPVNVPATPEWAAELNKKTPNNNTPHQTLVRRRIKHRELTAGCRSVRLTCQGWLPRRTVPTAKQGVAHFF
jgi:hypothetical protein